MELTHGFEVPVGIDRAWEVLNDIATIAPCMPGATLEGIEGDEFRGTVKVRVGPVQLTYAGTARFLERDAAGRRARIEADGTERRGGGTARAVITATLTEAADGATAVTVHTDLTVTGRPAQFGRGVMADVGDKLLGQFADCLAAEIAVPAEEVTPVATEPAGVSAEPFAADVASAGVAAPGTAARRRGAAGPEPPGTEAIDLIGLAGGSVLRRAAPVVAALVVAVWLLRRLRR